jgi:hypothetical protein
MILLIVYNRPKGEIVTRRVFDEAERAAADDARLEIELDLHRKKIDHEVVLLEASSEEALRRTHRRYFEDVGEILRSASRLTE